MDQEFQAIYENGILRLVKPLDLPEQTPVHGVVAGVSGIVPSSESTNEEEIAQQRLALNAMKAKIESIPQAPSSDGLSNRDHDALIYGQRK